MKNCQEINSEDVSSTYNIRQFSSALHTLLNTLVQYYLTENLLKMKNLTKNSW